MESNKFLRKCGEILLDIKSKKKKNKIYIFQCTFCDIQCDQLKKFSLHIGEEHLNDFDEILNEAQNLNEPEIVKETEFLNETELKFEAEPEEYKISSFNETPDVKVFPRPIETKTNTNPDPLDTVTAASSSTNTENLNCEVKYEIIEHEDEGAGEIRDGTVSISDSDKSDSDEDYIDEVPHKKRKRNQNAKKGKQKKRKENSNDTESDESKDAECNVSMTSGYDNLLGQQKYYALQNNQANTAIKLKTDHVNTKATKRNKKYNLEDKMKIVEIGSQGGEWQTLAAKQGIHYNTALRWITECRRELALPPLKYKRHKILTDEEQDQLLRWLEEKPLISLQELKEKVQRNYQKSLTISTISNNLNGKIYTVKYLRNEPIAMNNLKNKQSRANYVKNLQNFIANGKQIIWIDETNFNSYWRKSRSWNKKNPNICLMGGISISHGLLISGKRGAFEIEDAQEWLSKLINIWQDSGNCLQDLVIVCDHTLHQNQLENIFVNTPISLYRLAPFSSMLNPIEFIWLKIKAEVKAQLSTPVAFRSNSCEEHLLRLESIIDVAKSTITTVDCELAVQQATTFYPRAIKLQDMPVGL